MLLICLLLYKLLPRKLLVWHMAYDSCNLSPFIHELFYADAECHLESNEIVLRHPYLVLRLGTELDTELGTE